MLSKKKLFLQHPFGPQAYLAHNSFTEGSKPAKYLTLVLQNKALAPRKGKVGLRLVVVMQRWRQGSHASKRGQKISPQKRHLWRAMVRNKKTRRSGF